MSTGLTWSPLRCLNDRVGVPKGSGIYLIGEHDAALSDLGADAEYYGKNYPVSFRARYVGMTMSLRYGLASRLCAHAKCRGNKQVGEFIRHRGIQNLFYTYSDHSEADSVEVVLLACKSTNFLNWNNKGELVGPAKRFFFEHGPPAPLMIDDWEPEEQLAEFEAKKAIAQNWDALLAANPKYKRIVQQRSKSSSDA